MINEQDMRIMRLWQNQPELSLRALAQEAGMAQATLSRRVEALRARGVIKRRYAVIDWSALGYEVTVFLRVSIDKTASNAWGEFLHAAQAIPEIVVIETLVGRVDVRMDVRARTLEHYQEIYVEKILALPHIADIESLMLISEIKNASRLPI